MVGQTLIGVKGGLNGSSIIDNVPKSEVYGGEYHSYPSYSFQLEVKGRRPTPVHLGASLMYYQSSYNWYAKNTGHFPDGKDIHYTLDYLRLAIFPEFSFGKRFQFYCNVSPYLSIMIRSSKYGTSWDYDNILYYLKDTKIESGSANDDIHQVDFGFQESIGVSYLIMPCLGITLEESGSLGCLNINKNYLGGKVKNASLSFLIGISFIIPGKKSRTETGFNESEK